MLVSQLPITTAKTMVMLLAVTTIIYVKYGIDNTNSGIDDNYVTDNDNNDNSNNLNTE